MVGRVPDLVKFFGYLSKRMRSIQFELLLQHVVCREPVFAACNDSLRKTLDDTPADYARVKRIGCILLEGDILVMHQLVHFLPHTWCFYGWRVATRITGCIYPVHTRHVHHRPSQLAARWWFVMIYSDLWRYATTHLVVVVGYSSIIDRLIMYIRRRMHRKLLGARHFIRNTHILKKVNSIVSTPPSWLAY